MNNDLISRQAAMEEISKQQTYKMFEGEDTLYLDANDVGSVLASLPSAQPEPIKINIEDFNKEDWERFKKEWGNTPITVLPSTQPEAKPPKWVAEDRYVKNRFAVFPHCPRCNAGITTRQCYCMICGQHIDWSEDDE